MLVLAGLAASQVVLQWVHVWGHIGDLAEPHDEEDVQNKTEDVQTGDNS